jgi:hypothetical protein
MTEFVLYPVPVTVITKLGLPAIVFPGLSEDTVGADDETVNVIELEVLPPSVTVMV